MRYTFKSYDGKIIIANTPIKIGDLVTVKNYGLSYDCYTHAFMYFWGGNKCYDFNRNNVPSKKRLWKVMAMARHSYSNDILVYIQDINFNKLVIDLKALKLFKEIGKETEKILTLEVIKL